MGVQQPLILKKTPYLVLFVILIAGGMSGAYALTITLGADLIEILGILDMNANRITNVANPSAPADAATKQYVDSSPGTDTLALLECSTDQVTRWDGVNWVCTTIISSQEQITKLDNGMVDGSFSIAIGQDGFPVVLYESIQPDPEIRLIHCTQDDCSTSDSPTTIAITGSNDGSVAIGTDGNPVIVYGGGGVKFVHCTSTDCSTFDPPVVFPGSSSALSLAIGSDGFPVFTMYDGDFKLVHCTEIDCTESDPPATLDTEADFGLFYNTMAIGKDNFPIISYTDNDGNIFKILHCNSINCSSIDTMIAVDFGGNTLDMSMAIGSDDFPVISLEFGSNMTVIHCTRMDCTSLDDPITIDSKEGSEFLDTSIAIGKDGFPVISYRESFSQSDTLKFVKCTSLDCSTFETPRTLDKSSQQVGWENSIAIGTDGFPIISYNDSSNLTLKIFKLGGLEFSDNGG